MRGCADIVGAVRERGELVAHDLAGRRDPVVIEGCTYLTVGWVRGILCFNCNGGLGQFREDPELLAGAISYLKGTTWQRVLIHPGVYRRHS